MRLKDSFMVSRMCKLWYDHKLPFVLSSVKQSQTITFASRMTNALHFTEDVDRITEKCRI